MTIVDELRVVLDLGCAVLPCRPVAKDPLIEGGVKNASADLNRIAEWSEQHPGCWWGARPPENLFALDIDRHKHDGFVALHELEIAHAPLPLTLTNRTPNRGEHRLFRATGASSLKNRADVRPGLDVRSPLGYICVPPSLGYSWVDTAVQIAAAPDWLMELLPKHTDKSTGGKGGIQRGGRNDALFREVCRWRAADVALDDARARLRQYHDEHCAEPLEDPDQELEKILQSAWRYPPGAVTVQDFYAFMPHHSYIFIANREPWPAASVNARCVAPEEGRPSDWLDRNRPVDQMTWAPGLPELIEDRLVNSGGWIERPGSNTFNLYLPPNLKLGDGRAAQPWIEHVRKVFPDDADHIFKYLAHRAQRPAEKINHALVLIGAQGIGKDTLLEPVKAAVGPWNFVEVTPKQLLDKFNGFVKSVALRVSEARDLGDVDRYGFYDALKIYTAAPPDVLRCNEKNLREHSVFNVTSVIITSNYLTDGIFLPDDDRRHYVANSELTKDSFDKDYWRRLWNWYAAGGIGHVAAWLAEFDLTEFDPKAPPAKTRAFWDIVAANRAPEDAELADALDALGNPAAVTVQMVIDATEDTGFEFWLKERKHARQIPHRMRQAGYEAVRNDADKRDGLWIVGKKRCAIYAQKMLPIRERYLAAQRLVADPPVPGQM